MPMKNPPHPGDLIKTEIVDALGLSVAVQVVPPGTLPRFEMKARRFVVEE